VEDGPQAGATTGPAHSSPPTEDEGSGKEAGIEVEGVITEALPNAMFRVEIPVGDQKKQVLPMYPARCDRTISVFCPEIVSWSTLAL